VLARTTYLDGIFDLCFGYDLRVADFRLEGVCLLIFQSDSCAQDLNGEISMNLERTTPVSDRRVQVMKRHPPTSGD